MYKKLRVSLVIPAYNEQKLIIPTLKGVPRYVDRVYVVDDRSKDSTPKLVVDYAKKDRRVRLIRHGKNMGVGQAIITGYRQSSKDGYDIAVVVGGDNQMDLADMPNFLEPFVKNEADYVKGNRWMWRSLESMPKHRLLGNSTLSFLTKIASGYWKIFDTQDGYTAVRKRVIDTVDWDKAWKGYGYVSDWLIRMNAYGFRVKDVPRRPIYLPGERQSQIGIGRYIFKVLPMITRGFFWRLKEKYIIRDFHPLVFFYTLGLITLPLGIIYGLWLLWYKNVFGVFTGTNAVLVALLVITGLQSLFFAMLFDMEASG
ncbi:MAG: glycosyltransferase family 2 protein [Candidatus Aenigmarchaeota archaeon]|nr:glycosyltransferase family 2 protein [Candidatus Aenigmarchaeota archaeon]